MTLGSLDQRVLELIALLQGERQSLPDNCRFVTLESERRFISAEDPVESIWILLQGKVKAKEEYPSGDVYVFRKFRAPEVFGEMSLSRSAHLRVHSSASVHALFSCCQSVFMNVPETTLFIKRTILD